MRTAVIFFWWYVYSVMTLASRLYRRHLLLPDIVGSIAQDGAEELWIVALAGKVSLS
jgi:hypothetical protein